MSWHGPSAPRIEGIATKSRVVASCASNPASTASRIFCWLAFITFVFLAQSLLETRSKHNLAGTPVPRIAFRIGMPPIQSRPTLAPTETPMPANRNVMYLIIGALIVAVGVLGYNLYQTKKQPEGLQINLGPNGLKIQNK